MRIFATIIAALLFTFTLASAPGFAQEDRPDHAQEQPKDKDKDKDKTKDTTKQNDNARPDENRRDQARPEERDRTRPDNARPEAARPQDQTRPEEQNRPEERRNGNPVRQEQARPEEHAGNDQRQGGHRGQRIPDDQFRTHFGREHHFHVRRETIVNQAQPEFVYGNYTFELAQPWPAEWSYDDDCYVDYVDDNYYLYDLNHPGIQIMVFVIGG